MIDTMRSILAYVLVLGILVFFHELGHYLAARARGVTVEAFSIGFGPTLLAWRAKSGTVWKLSALPLGGYVKMQGWGEDQDAPTLPGSFSGASLGSKAIIVAAGPLANLILAFVLFTGLFALYGQTITEPVVTQVVAGTPAAASGLQAGDRILNIGGHSIQTFDDMLEVIALHPDTEMVFTYQRQGATLTKQIKLSHKNQDGDEIGSLGVACGDERFQSFGPIGAVRAALLKTYASITDTTSTLYNLIVHQQGLKLLHGPLGIAQITGKVASFGLPSLINLIAILSVNIGLLNLVPIPILDGGHLLFYAAELIYGRPLPPKSTDFALRFGGALIVSLMMFATFNDLTRMGAVHWVAHLLG